MIEKAKPKDLPEIIEVYQDAIFNLAKKNYTKKQLDVWAAGAHNTKNWESRIENQYFLIYRLNNHIAGFASLKNLNHVDLLFVRSQFKGQGIAQTLYHHLENIAKNNQIKSLTVEASHTALPFFIKNGFQEISKQTLTIQSVEIENFKMIKYLP